MKKAVALILVGLGAAVIVSAAVLDGGVIRLVSGVVLLLAGGYAAAILDSEAHAYAAMQQAQSHHEEVKTQVRALLGMAEKVNEMEKKLSGLALSKLR